MLLARLGCRLSARNLSTPLLCPLHLTSTGRYFGNIKAPKPRTDHAQQKQLLIEKKKAHVEVLLKQGIVKKATDLDGEQYNVDEDWYTVPEVDEDAEREYILFEEETKKRRKRKSDSDAEMIEDLSEEAKALRRSYTDWCTYYQPLFEKAPYSLGYQEPDVNGNYTWTEAMESANRMVFGNDGFRPLQLEALNASMKGEDVFLSLPTGGGKSLCFWLRALLSPGIVFVISPLIALIHDQIQKLQSRGIPVLRLDSATRSASMKALKQDGLDYKLIYITPERMRSNEFLEVFRNLYLNDQVSMVAIDEAHCISEWGHDFRPSYRRLGIFRKEFPNVPIMSMTATATQQVQKDILKSLRIPDATVFASSFNRPNIYYEVRPKASAVDDISYLLTSEKYSKASGIIYCLTKSDCEELADELRSRSIYASPYHGSMNVALRAQIQDSWKNGTIKVLCTTTAFGLGVDKQDIRYVLHHTVPLSLEAYYQQTGRAGRDGRDATCILYYAESDLARAAKMLAASSNTPSAVIDDDSVSGESGAGIKVDLMDNMVTYCGEQKKCRREILLAYFGEKIDRSACNHKCDNCQRLLVSSQPKSESHIAAHDFVPPPHISRQPNLRYALADRNEKAFWDQPVEGEDLAYMEEELDDEVEFMEDEEEEVEKQRMSPLERLKRRREQQRAWQLSKLSHPSRAGVIFDKTKRDKHKKLLERKRKFEASRKANEERIEKMRDAMFAPDDGRAASPVGTEDNSKTSQKPFASNSLRNSNKEKINKTGRITEPEQSGGSSLPRYKSLSHRSTSKLNKTGRIKAKDSTEYEGPYSKPSFTKKKLNKTGRLNKGDNDEIRTPLKPSKLNKTGRVTKDSLSEKFSKEQTADSKTYGNANPNATFISSSGGASAALPSATKQKISFSALKSVYNDIAIEHTKAGKDISGEFFSEHVMVHIWESKPTSVHELTSIPGVGQQNATKYADKILPLFRTDK